MLRSPVAIYIATFVINTYSLACDQKLQSFGSIALRTEFDEQS